MSNNNCTASLQAVEEESKRRAAEAAAQRAQEAAAAAEKRAHNEIVRICSEHQAKAKAQLEIDVHQAREVERAKYQASLEVNHLSMESLLRHPPSCNVVADSHLSGLCAGKFFISSVSL